MSRVECELLAIALYESYIRSRQFIGATFWSSLVSDERKHWRDKAQKIVEEPSEKYND